MTLDRLVYAEGASWDPTMACLSGTRANILSIIHMWARSLDGQNVFWLKGVAGSGKSAIAHTIAQSLHKDGHLASSFFFNRSVAARNTSQSLFTTIARDIAARYPAIAADICARLEDDPSLASAPLCRQFEEFILGPLRRHPIVHSSPLVIVIDALDETMDDEDSDIELLRILRAEASKLPPQIRILVTSRPTRDVVDYLSGKDHITSHPIDIDSVESGQDIEAYIDNQLQDEILCQRMGSPGPDKVLIDNLKNSAEGLFIWIVTVFRYVRNADNPEENLRALLSKSDTPGRLDPRKRMDSLYTVIIEACGDWVDPEFCKGYRMFMGAIIAAKRPLSLTALRALHGGTPKLSRGSLPQRFGSVLMGLDGDDEPVRVLHLSFHEFITGHTTKSRKFHIAEKERSGRLAELCIQTMVREIAAVPILGTGYLLKKNDDGPGIPKVFGVSEQLLYSCEYWSDHISDVDEPDAAIAKFVQDFLRHHNTIWIEIVSSMSIFRGSLAVWHWLQVRAPEIKEQGHKSQASILQSLSMRLKYVGRLEEAVVAGQEAVDLRRALAVEQQAMSNPDLASSLRNLAVCLLYLGRHEEALAVIQETLDLYRALAAERPAAFNGDLARSLNSQSVCLADLGQHKEALAVIQEASGLYRALAAERPVVFSSKLARSLGSLSVCLENLGRHGEALAVIQEALDMYRVLVVETSAAFNVDLVHSLHNLSMCLSTLGLHEEALAVTQEALDLYRVLAAQQPAAFNADLAHSLHNLSVHLSALGRQDEALVAIKETLYLYRAIVVERPAVFNSYLAGSLGNLSLYLSALGLYEEALPAIEETLDLYRVLAAERPTVFNNDLARSLSSLSVCLADLGQHEEALAVIQEALDLYRALADELPVLFNADLACSLHNLSTPLSALGLHEDALTANKEALDLYRALAAERPAAFNDNLAMALNNISCRLLDLDRHEEALVAITEALDIYRNLAAEQPAAFNFDLANILDTISTCLSHLGQKEEALAAIQEAVNLCRALGTDSKRPAAFNRYLYLFLINISARLSDLERWAEVLTVIHEVVAFRRALAPERPAVHDPEVARSLEQLYTCLLKAERQEEAELISLELYELKL